ncbi:MAG: HlyD family secretion protein [Chloroflexota bacterium]
MSDWRVASDRGQELGGQLRQIVRPRAVGSAVYRRLPGSKDVAGWAADAPIAGRCWVSGQDLPGGPVDLPNPRSESRLPSGMLRFRPGVARPRRLAVTVVAVFLVALACALGPRLGGRVSSAQSTGGGRLEASGIIQADEVTVASEWGGQIVELWVEEGTVVAAGDRVLRLDTSLLDAQIRAARAAVAVAEAGLAQAQAGARPGQVAMAEAQLAQAEVARLAARQTVSDTLSLVENPQEILLQIAVMQAQAEAAAHQVAQAVMLKDAAAVANDKFEEIQADWSGGRKKVWVDAGPVEELRGQLPEEYRPLLPADPPDGVYLFGDIEVVIHGDTYELYRWMQVEIPFELHLAPNGWWQAWVGVNAAVAQQAGLEALLAQLYAQRAHPQSLEALVDESLAALAQAEAQVAAAQAQVDGLKAGVSVQQLAALEARVLQARAALDSLLTQRAALELTAPMAGVVVSVPAHAGEVAAAGAPLFTLARLSEVRLRLYLPETQIGQVRLGQRVQVTVDSFPGRVFEGEVAYLADSAAFTPRNVATKEERVHLVFAVEVRLSNDDGALKPGMPADAVFVEG